ncbi:hypothetical protein CHUAL_009644 [Chamberlinius hualienensis]
MPNVGQPCFSLGDLVLVDTHLLSYADLGVTHKFFPVQDGPFHVCGVTSSTISVADPVSLARVMSFPIRQCCLFVTCKSPVPNSGLAVVLVICHPPAVQPLGRPAKIAFLPSPPVTRSRGPIVAPAGLDCFERYTPQAL